MKFKLKPGTAKKKREQMYLSLFFAFVIWLLFALLFSQDDNNQVFVLFIVASIIFVPWVVLKKITPYLKGLTSNIENAYFEIDEQTITFQHFDNLKDFNRQTLEFSIDDIVNLKKAFRKDDSINKITLTLKDKSKVVVEDFENMAELVAMLQDRKQASS